MDYARPALAERLAAEYVLGTLRGAARRRFVSLLQAHPALRQAVQRWEDHLLPLAASVTEVPPSAQVWSALEARLWGPSQTVPRGWRRWLTWRLGTGFSSAVALALSIAWIAQTWQVPTPQAPVLVLMVPNGAAAADPALLARARFVASVSADGRALVLRPLEALPLAANRALELWALPSQGAPRSLGLVAADQATPVLRAKLLQDTAAFAVSVEPAGGSPTGAPTGPVIAMGPLES